MVKATETVPVDYDLAAEGSASPASGAAPLAVAFSGSASGGTPPYTYAWDFGDGGIGDGRIPLPHLCARGDLRLEPHASPTP